MESNKGPVWGSCRYKERLLQHRRYTPLRRRVTSQHGNFALPKATRDWGLILFSLNKYRVKTYQHIFRLHLDPTENDCSSYEPSECISNAFWLTIFDQILAPLFIFDVICGKTYPLVRRANNAYLHMATMTKQREKMIVVSFWCITAGASLQLKSLKFSY